MWTIEIIRKVLKLELKGTLLKMSFEYGETEVYKDNVFNVILSCSGRGKMFSHSSAH